MQELNDRVNANHAIAREFMQRSIEAKGDITYGPNSPIASAFERSDEFKDLIHDMAGSTIGAQIKFRKDPNLSRSIHDGTLTGELEVQGQNFSFNGSLQDTYDFRYDWLPKSWTWRGVGLRLAGNLAKACTDVGLMVPYKVLVELDFAGSK